MKQRFTVKRCIRSILLCTLLIGGLFPVTASAQTPIRITQQPQNRYFPENAVASWRVEAVGEQLSYDWYIVYNGVPYNTKRSFAENHPWQAGVTGDGYGSNAEGNVFFINGIGMELNGAEIYCVISDGTSSVASAAAYLSVGMFASPPEIIVPASVEVEQDQILKLSCQATAPENDSVNSYLWYETTTGSLSNIAAIGVREGYEETNSILVCDTTQIGTRYYVCAVGTVKGGFAYTSVIPVTVKAAQTTTEMQPETSALPESGYQPATETDPPQPKDEKTAPATDVTAANTDAEQPSNLRKLDLQAVIWIVLGGAIVTGLAAIVILVIQKSKRDQ